MGRLRPIITELDDESGEWEIADSNDESTLDQLIEQVAQDDKSQDK